MAGQPEHNNNADVTLKLAEEQIALTKQKIVDGHVRVTVPQLSMTRSSVHCLTGRRLRLSM